MKTENETIKKTRYDRLIFKKAILFAALGFATSIALSATADAQITWGGNTMANDSDVLTVGNQAYAYDWANSNVTVNGVSFTGTASSAAAGANVGLSGFSANTTSAYTSTASPFAALSAAYRSILVGGDYANGVTAVTITLNNLTIGDEYAVQFWVEDPRGGSESTRTETVTSVGGNTIKLYYEVQGYYTAAAGGVGQYAIGTFTAAATTQIFTITGNASTQLNALQVRDVTGTGYTPPGVPPAPPLAAGTWNGGSIVDSDWSDATNWNGLAFTSGNTVTFGGTTRQINTNDLADLALTGIIFSTANWNISGNPITLSGNITDNIGGSNTWGLTTTLSSTPTVAQSASGDIVNFTGVLSGSGGITKTAGSGGQGQIYLSNTNNSFTGAVSVPSGTVFYYSLAGAGTNSSLGAGSGAVNIGSGNTSYGGTLNYIGVNNGDTGNGLTFAGNTATTTETFANNSPSNSSLEFDGAVTINNSIVLDFNGISTGTNTFTGYFNNDNTINVPVNVSGPGTWSFGKGIISTANMTVANNAHFVLGYDGSGTSDLLAPLVTVSSGSTFDVSAYDQNNNPFVLAQFAGYTQTLIAGRTNGTSATDIYGSLNLGGAGDATLNVAGSGVAGTLGMIGNLIPASGDINFDLGTNTIAGSGVNDLINVGGNIDLSQGTATILVKSLKGVINTNAGSYYTLMTYGGSLIGTASGLTVPSPGRQYTAGTVSTANPGLVQVSFGPSGQSAANLVWEGEINNNWDVQTTKNWLNGTTNDYFDNADSVNFNDTASLFGVNISQNLTAGAITISNNINSYSFASTTGGGINGGSLLKEGAAELAIGTANSYSGGTVVSSGILSGGKATAFGSGNVTLGDINTGTNTAILVLTNGVNVANPILISSNALAGNLVLGLEGGSPAFSGLVTLQRSITLSNANSGLTLFNVGGMAGTGDVILNGANSSGGVGGQFHWQGPSPTPTTVNYYMTGNIFLTNGAFLDTQGGAIITNTASLILATNTTFAIALNTSPYNNQVVNALIGAGTVESGPGVTWNLTLTVGAGNGSGTFSGSISNYQSYYVGLIKAGTGIETLTGNSSGSSGFTTVSNGVLVVDNTAGSGLGSGPVSVNAGASLAGGGAIYSSSNTVTVNGILAVGSPGHVNGSSFTLNNKAGLFIGSGGALNVSLFSGAGAGDNTGNAAAADVLNAQCPVALNSAILTVNNPNDLSGWAVGDKWKIANWNSTPTNTFTTLNLPALPGGLAWDTSSLYSSGVIGIVSNSGPGVPANITGVTVSGGNLVISGINLNGGQNFHYEVLSSTNLTLPLANWTVLVTNSFNTDGTFNYTNAINPTNPAGFFDVKAVQ